MEKIPNLEYWMIGIAISALQKEYTQALKNNNYHRMLSHVAKEKGMEAAKEAEKQLQSNRFGEVGRVWLSMRKLEEMREAYSKAITG